MSGASRGASGGPRYVFYVRMMMNGYRALTRVLIFATALVLGADPQAETADAKSVVEKLHTTLLDVMKRADALGYSGRYDTLAPVISASFDFDTIGQKLLGRYWAELNADQRKQFIETFEQLSTATYAARFDGFKNENVSHRLAGNQGRLDDRHGRVGEIGRRHRPVQVHPQIRR